MAERRLQARVLSSGLAVGESPRWHDGRLWVCNWGRREVVSVDDDGGRGLELQVPTTLPFSIDWDPDGSMLVVAGPEKLLLRRSPDGSLHRHADLSAVSDRAWNEIVVDGRGAIYVNGVGFDLMTGEDFAPGQIALVGQDGSPRPVADGLAFPNGMAVTDDNRTLIVAESYGRKLTAFDIGPGGDLSNRRLWADLGDGTPDGICIDAEDAVWYADVPNRRCVRVFEGGEVSATVALDRAAFACMLGGADGRMLFIAAAEWAGRESMGGERQTGQILTVTAPAPHAGWP
jgi:sugar lactone lactonase YvrE